MVLIAALLLAAGAAAADPVVEETPLYHAEISVAAVSDARLAALLRARAEAVTAEFRAWAAEADPERPYQFSLVDEVVFASDAWISVRRDLWAYTGGAHGNAWIETTLWDVAAGRPAGLDALLTPRGVERLSAAARAAIEDEIWGGEIDPFWIEAVDAATAPEALGVFTLAPGDMPGAAAEIEILFAPYAVGPYALGSNAVRIARLAFEPDVTEAGRALFGGGPLD
ncbi:MAG: DUF4163 domain-containing protein [Rhodobacteraceae bacterium]|nr:MAG: DUF4163 domain-containing protein [Paracoccaceae bacterium]